jgi:hypothetical protein
LSAMQETQVFNCSVSVMCCCDPLCCTVMCCAVGDQLSVMRLAVILSATDTSFYAVISVMCCAGWRQAGHPPAQLHAGARSSAVKHITSDLCRFSSRDSCLTVVCSCLSCAARAGWRQAWHPPHAAQPGVNAATLTV